MSFKGVCAYIHKHRPKVVILENVPELAEADPDEASDSDFIIEWFKDEKYLCKVFFIAARSFGSLPRRDRLYWLAIADMDASAPLMSNFAHMVDVMSGSCRRLRTRLDDYLLDTECLQCTNKSPSDVAGKDFKYKDACQSFNIGLCLSIPGLP
jgi:site-specific DNA-cytosine methylase